MAAHPRWIAVLALALIGCGHAAPTRAPTQSADPPPAPVLSSDDEALLASLLADDPGDFHAKRARIWRIGAARWSDEGPELSRPPRDSRAGGLTSPLEVVIVDPEGPRVLLPLQGLGVRALADDADQAALWSALHVVAVLEPEDLVAGLERELRPTPWLTVAAGVGLTPLEGGQDTLRVRWSEPACGFSLELMLDAGDFGPLYEPGPGGSQIDPPMGAGQGEGLRLAPGTAIYPEADATEPVVRLDADGPSPGERMSMAQRVALTGDAPRRGRQPITLRCRGVEIRGFVDKQAILEEGAARYTLVAEAPTRSSSCEGADEAAKISVPRATPLYEPRRSGEATLVGVVREDVSLPANPGADGWWTSCVPSPWGDLVFQFRLVH